MFNGNNIHCNAVENFFIGLKKTSYDVIAQYLFQHCDAVEPISGFLDRLRSTSVLFTLYNKSDH